LYITVIYFSLLSMVSAKVAKWIFRVLLTLLTTQTTVAIIQYCKLYSTLLTIVVSLYLYFYEYIKNIFCSFCGLMACMYKISAFKVTINCAKFG